MPSLAQPADSISPRSFLSLALCLSWSTRPEALATSPVEMASSTTPRPDLSPGPPAGHLGQDIFKEGRPPDRWDGRVGVTVTTSRAVSGYDSGNHNIKKKNPNSSPRPDLVAPWCFLVRLRGVQVTSTCAEALVCLLVRGTGHSSLLVLMRFRAERQYIAVLSSC